MSLLAGRGPLRGVGVGGSQPVGWPRGGQLPMCPGGPWRLSSLGVSAGASVPWSPGTSVPTLAGSPVSLRGPREQLPRAFHGPRRQVLWPLSSSGLSPPLSSSPLLDSDSSPPAFPSQITPRRLFPDQRERSPRPRPGKGREGPRQGCLRGVRVLGWWTAGFSLCTCGLIRKWLGSHTGDARHADVHQARRMILPCP